jgi:hypothetical protein
LRESRIFGSDVALRTVIEAAASGALPDLDFYRSKSLDTSAN